MRLVKLPWGEYVNPAAVVAVDVVERKYDHAIRVLLSNGDSVHGPGGVPGILMEDDLEDAASVINGENPEHPYR